MTKNIKKLQYKKNYTYYVQFEDGIEGEIDLKPFLWGEVFEELKNINYFKKATVDQVGGTISWPNGADIAPETVYDIVSKNLTSSTSKFY